MVDCYPGILVNSEVGKTNKASDTDRRENKPVLPCGPVQPIESLQMINALKERIRLLESHYTRLTVEQVISSLNDSPNTKNPEDWVVWLESQRYLATLAESSGLRECFVFHLYAKLKSVVSYHSAIPPKPDNTSAPDYLQLSIESFSSPLYVNLLTQINCNPFTCENIHSRAWCNWFKNFCESFLLSIPYMDESDTRFLVHHIYQYVDDFDFDLKRLLKDKIPRIKSFPKEEFPNKKALVWEVRSFLQSTLIVLPVYLHSEVRRRYRLQKFHGKEIGNPTQRDQRRQSTGHTPKR
ncbi:hypothetical protein DICA4_F21528 [Diutina catenulata]